MSNAVPPDDRLTALTALFTEMAAHGRVPAASWPAGEDPGAYAVCLRDGWLEPEPPYDPLRPEAIRRRLSRRARDWLATLAVHPVIGSTNSTLMDQAARQPVGGSACLAELQLAGRGRRGRTWFSPFAVNLALSLGFESERRPADLAGISLVVGLAVLDAIERLGGRGLALKWPNDLLLEGAKLGGILTEVVQCPSGSRLVAGIGINVRIPDAVRSRLDHPVADLAVVTGQIDRSELAAAVISAVVEFEQQFEAAGFGPFRSVFDNRHAYHGREVRVLQAGGDVAGVVRGVSADGGLSLETAAGMRVFHSGEVSLRGL
jgi:BirA family transcriptional regulator, biotin operon repressor / biotin---[acetyl-CoA-carboxylase] ligase